MRPDRIILITGTGTEVGKTWVAARLLEELRRRRLAVAARKPAQSYDREDRQTDADVLGRASGEMADAVCPRHRWYPVPMAPPMAAAVLGVAPPTLAQLAAEIENSWPAAGTDVGLIEGAGGAASPLADDSDTAALGRAVAAEVAVVVADPGLGTINLVRLTAGVLTPIPVVVYLNRFDAGDDLHQRNRDWLSERDRIPVVTDPAGLTRLCLE